MKANKKKVLPNLLLLCFGVYSVYTLAYQQIELYRYDKSKQNIDNQIAQMQQEIELNKQRIEFIKSEAYIEEVAREKLGMLRPEEKIYIDVSK